MSRDTPPRAEHVLKRVRASADPAGGVAEHVFASLEQRLAREAHADDTGAGSDGVAAVVSSASRWQNVARVAARLGRWGGFGLLTGAIGYQLGVASNEHEAVSAAPADVIAGVPMPVEVVAPPVSTGQPEVARPLAVGTKPAPASVAVADAPSPGPATAETPSIKPGSRSRATPTRAPRARRAARAEATPPAAPSNGAPPLSMAEILERLQRAQAALRDSDSHAALAELDALAALEHGGALADEQLVLRALALCDLGRVGEARHVLAELDARGAESIYRSRLEQSCAAAFGR